MNGERGALQGKKDATTQLAASIAVPVNTPRKSGWMTATLILCMAETPWLAGT